LLNRKSLEEKLRMNLSEKNDILSKIYGVDEIDVDEIIQTYSEFDKIIDPYITDTTLLINEAAAEGKTIIAEGAQGALLDVDHGTYPYVTSSNPTSGGACTGLGIPPTSIKRIIGVVKAYCTRVGNGPFPTELNTKIGEFLRQQGSEYGATTGRPRRCGWLDLVALKYSVMINGISEIALTKLDVLDDFDEISICTEYKLNSKTTKYFPADIDTLAQAEPVFVKLPGWKTKISGAKNLQDLPVQTQNYLKYIEDYTGAKITIVSLSPDRDDTIVA
jgi:adenylosuccinate synthase